MCCNYFFFVDVEARNRGNRDPTSATPEATLPEKTSGFGPKSVFTRERMRSRTVTLPNCIDDWWLTWWCGWYIPVPIFTTKWAMPCLVQTGHVYPFLWICSNGQEMAFVAVTCATILLQGVIFIDKTDRPTWTTKWRALCRVIFSVLVVNVLATS